MGDVLPPKRQTVVERLKRRFELYRRHQNSVLPRYEQASNGVYDSHRQDTLLLKQRYLESKAKKAKTKTEHHRTYKEAVSDAAKIQVHQKLPLKRLADEPAPTPEVIDADRPHKVQRVEDKQQDSHKAHQQTTPAFSVQIVQQFSASQPQHTIQMNVAVQSLPKTPPPVAKPPTCQQQKECTKQEEGLQQRPLLECKKEIEDDSFDAATATPPAIKNANHNNVDRLPDDEAFVPSLMGVHPDVLQDLIEDVFVGGDGVPDFGDLGGEDGKDLLLDDLVRSSQHATDLFRGMSSGDGASGALTHPTSSFGLPQQRLPSYGGSPSLPASLGLDFNLSEPIPAALTLKQMAEQHQSMKQQKQQLSSSPLGGARPPPFSPDTFNMAGLRSPGGYLSSPNPTSPKLRPSSPGNPNIFANYTRGTPSSNFPAESVIFEALQQEPEPSITKLECHPGEQVNKGHLAFLEQKLPAYGSSSSFRQPCVRQSGPVQQRRQQMMEQMNIQMQPQRPPMGVPMQQQRMRLNVNLPEARRQVNQQENLQVRQQEHLQARQHNPQQMQQQPPPSVYGNYPQHSGNPAFHPAMPQPIGYNPHQFPQQAQNPAGRPPPDYQPASQLPRKIIIGSEFDFEHEQFGQNPSKNKFGKQQRPPNVTITRDGTAIGVSHDWRMSAHAAQYRTGQFTPQDGFVDPNSNVNQSLPSSPLYGQFRLPVNEMSINRIRAGMVHNSMMQPKQRLIVPHGPRNPIMKQQHSVQMGHMSANNDMVPMYPDITRQDGSHINLDFLDNIESSASDLLNFDPNDNQYFPILDDMDILNK